MVKEILKGKKTIGIQQPRNLHNACAVLISQLLSRVQLFATPWTVSHQAPLSMRILQARILEWVAMPSSRGSSQPKDGTQISGMPGSFF